MQLQTLAQTFDCGVSVIFLGSGSSFAIIFFKLSPLVLAQSSTSEQFLVELAKASLEVLERLALHLQPSLGRFIIESSS